MALIIIIGFLMGSKYDAMLETGHKDHGHNDQSLFLFGFLFLITIPQGLRSIIFKRM